jgi:hypothetical protein
MDSPPQICRVYETLQIWGLCVSPIVMNTPIVCKNTGTVNLPKSVPT